jgi:[ribosomal protein S18]-alanine N-acetyltransferase
MNAIPKPQVAFRPMQKDDLDTIVAIEQVIFPYPWTRGNFLDSLNAGHSCWVMQQDATIVGYAVVMMVLDEAHLLNISVAKAMQGNGLGRLLLEHVMQIGRQYGGLNMFLEVRPSNTSALRLYESIGFNEMAIRRNYYPAKHGREDAVLMGAAL